MGTFDSGRPPHRDPRLVRVRKIVGRVGPDVVIESVVVPVDGRAEHRYRIVGGPDSGREFESLSAVGAYVVRLDGETPY